MGFNLLEYIYTHRKIEHRIPMEGREDLLVYNQLPRIVCADGFTMSVQVGRSLYCRPREDTGPWTHVEVGFPSEAEGALLPYAEDPENPTGTVYSYVPVGIVEAVISNHGGLQKPEDAETRILVEYAKEHGLLDPAQVERDLFG